MRSLLAGHLDQADTFASEALSSGIRPEGITAPQYYAVQLLAIRREQLRIAELEPAVRELVATNPHRPAWRAALATVLCETDRLDEAAAELDVLARQDFADIPPDGDWMVAMTLLADVASELGDAGARGADVRAAAALRSSNVVIGLAAVCLGATARYLGRLAMAMGEQAEAIQLLQRALERNIILKAPIQVAHTELDLARVLGPGPRSSRADRVGSARRRGARAAAGGPAGGAGERRIESDRGVRGDLAGVAAS